MHPRSTIAAERVTAIHAEVGRMAAAFTAVNLSRLITGHINLLNVCECQLPLKSFILYHMEATLNFIWCDPPINTNLHHECFQKRLDVRYLVRLLTQIDVQNFAHSSDRRRGNNRLAALSFRVRYPRCINQLQNFCDDKVKFIHGLRATHMRAKINYMHLNEERGYVLADSTPVIQDS